MVKTKVREVTIKSSEVTIPFFKKAKTSKEDYDFSGIHALRQLLSNERMRILDTIKNKNPSSIYELAKIIDRSFKSVSEDIKLLERFGFIELIEEKTKKRKRHRPQLIVDTLTIHVKI
jgi:predicted transcriptional regulator